jgi:hypothetical protein
MKIKELKKKEALCEAINMKFDEANELFEAETLQSMQMAQISGGTTAGPIVAFWKIIDAIGKGTYALDTIKKAFDSAADFLNGWKTIMGSTPPPGNPTVTIEIDENGHASLTLNGRADSIIVSNNEVKIYGPSNTPTPITNGNGSTDMP